MKLQWGFLLQVQLFFANGLRIRRQANSPGNLTRIFEDDLFLGLPKRKPKPVWYLESFCLLQFSLGQIVFNPKKIRLRCCRLKFPSTFWCNGKGLICFRLFQKFAKNYVRFFFNKVGDLTANGWYTWDVRFTRGPKSPSPKVPRSLG